MSTRHDHRTEQSAVSADTALVEDAVALFSHVGTTVVADALGKWGAVPGIAPFPGNARVVAGPVHYVEAYGESNWPLHRAAEQAPAGSVVFAEALDVNGRALFGELVTRYLIEKRGVAGIVVNGLVRDAGRLSEAPPPVWCKGVSPIGCFNTRPPEPSAAVRERLEREARRSYADPRAALAVADPSGVVIVPLADLEEVFARVLEVQQTEIEWAEALDQGFSTFEIVCLHKHTTLRGPR